MSGLATASPALPQLAAEYELLRELGRGAAAVVFHARDRRLGREVAIKLIRAQHVGDAESLARFEREARLLARLEHPNIIRIYSFHHLPDASLALVTQYVPGRTLKQEILSSGPLAWPRAERILREIAGALRCAHASGVIHRDVKSDNIFLDERTGTALLADFGVARPLAEEARLTAHGVTMGTPAYMSPEQIDCGEIDARSDLYSLGLVGWEMLSGEMPWEGESFYGILHKQKTAELPSLRKLRPDIPARIRTAIEGAIRKDPDARWADAAEFAERLVHPDGARLREWLRTFTDRLADLRLTGARASAAAGASADPPDDQLPTVFFARDARAAEAEPVIDQSEEGDPSGSPAPGEAVVASAPGRDTATARPLGSRRRPLHRFSGQLNRLVKRLDRALVPPRSTPREALFLEDPRRAAERHRLREWCELREMMERRTLAHAGAGRHPRWRLYPAGYTDFERLLEATGGAVQDAETLMAAYGSLDVLLEDTPSGVETRTAGAVPAAVARPLLAKLRRTREQPPEHLAHSSAPV